MVAWMALDRLRCCEQSCGPRWACLLQHPALAAAAAVCSLAPSSCIQALSVPLALLARFDSTCSGCTISVQILRCWRAIFPESSYI